MRWESLGKKQDVSRVLSSLKAKPLKKREHSPNYFSAYFNKTLTYNKRIGYSFGCDWREKFCGKVEQWGFLRGCRLKSCLS